MNPRTRNEHKNDRFNRFLCPFLCFPCWSGRRNQTKIEQICQSLFSSSFCQPFSFCWYTFLLKCCPICIRDEDVTHKLIFPLWVLGWNNSDKLDNESQYKSLHSCSNTFFQAWSCFQWQLIKHSFAGILISELCKLKQLFCKSFDLFRKCSLMLIIIFNFLDVFLVRHPFYGQRFNFYSNFFFLQTVSQETTLKDAPFSTI